MTSDRKIATNRDNAKKSKGPRTHSGKARVGRNALRHGLGSANFGGLGAAEKIGHLAKAICKDDTNLLQYEQATIIAESYLQVARVRAARIDAIERFRRRLKPDLPRSPIEGEIDGIIKRLAVALNAADRNSKADVGQQRLGPAAEGWIEAGSSQIADDPAPGTRDDVECLCLALPELLSFDRYERRALSRRRRAIRTLAALRE